MTDFATLTESRVKNQTTWIEIDPNALRHNILQINSLMLPGAGIMAVVKANAYGHGLFEVVQSIKDQISHFGVASLDEALSLRNFDIEHPVLLFGVLRGEANESAIQNDITLSVSSLEQAKEISQAAERLKQPALIHIKIDTGMGRLGIPKNQAVETILQIASMHMLKLEGIFTHFPQGDQEQDPFTKEQITGFNKIIDRLGQKGIHVPYCHAANSNGIANFKEAHFNLVRPGISIYGLGSLRSKIQLKPALSWKARVILVKKLGKGESCGYNRTFIAQEETLIGILPVGYSHGYPFALSNKSRVLFKGNSYPIIGRVSMDYVAVNFGPLLPNVKIGDVVTLIGQDGKSQVSAEELAELAGTIPYEIVTRLNPSIPRIVF